MSEKSNFPHEQPFNVTPRPNRTKKNSWWSKEKRPARKQRSEDDKG